MDYDHIQNYTRAPQRGSHGYIVLVTSFLLGLAHEVVCVCPAYPLQLNLLTDSMQTVYTFSYKAVRGAKISKALCPEKY